MKTVKVAHTADIHVGKNGKARDELKGDDIWKDQDRYDALYQMAGDVAGEEPDVVLVSGDLFDTPRPPYNAMFAVMQALKTITGCGARVVIIQGNHSTSGSWDEVRESSPLKILGMMDGVDVAYEKTERFIYEDLNLEITAVPDWVLVQKEEIPKAQDNGRIQVLMVHGVAEGGSGAEYSLLERKHRDIDAGKFQEYDFVALGHFHKHMAIKGGNAYYPGSTCTLTFGEEWVKGWILAEIGKGSLSVEFRELETRTWFTVRANVKNETGSKEILGVVKAALKEKKKELGIRNSEGCAVRIILENCQAGVHKVPDREKFENLVEGAVMVRIERITEEGVDVELEVEGIKDRRGDWTSYMQTREKAGWIPAGEEVGILTEEGIEMMEIHGALDERAEGEKVA